MSGGFSVTHEASPDAERIWRAIEMTHDRITRSDADAALRQAELPRLMADAMKTAIIEVMADPQRQTAFWQGGVNHIRNTWTAEAGRSVIGMGWAAVKVASVLILVLAAFGPAGFKALLANWWGMDVK